MAVHRRGLGRYVATVRVGAASNPSGKTVLISHTCNTLEQAKKAETEIRVSIFKCGTWPPRPVLPYAKDALPLPSAFTPGKGTLVDALREAWLFPARPFQGWKAQKSGERCRLIARECIDHLGPMRLCSEITPDDIARLVATFRARGNADTTIFRKLNALYRLFWHAERKGWIRDREQFRPPEELLMSAADFE